MNKTYQVVIGQATNALVANDICKRLYNGSLASVTSQYLFHAINDKLKTVVSRQDNYKERHAFWTCGMVKHDQIDLLGVVNMDPPPSFQQGMLLVT